MFYQDRMQDRRLKYFSRPPWKSYQFLASTLFLLMVAFVPIEIVMDFRLVRLFPIQIIAHSGLSANSSTFWMFAPLVPLIVLWVRVWKAHNDVYEAVHLMSVEQRSEDGRVAAPLSALAYMLYGGFALTLFSVCLAYAATEDFLKASLHQ